MGKIKFNKDHFELLKLMLVKYLFDNRKITTKFNVELNVVELLHTTTINSLNTIRLSLSKKIEELEAKDEWISEDSIQEELSNAKDDKKLVNLIIGYKRYILEQEEIAKKRAELINKINNIKEAVKTPEDKLKEAEEALKELED